MKHVREMRRYAEEQGFKVQVEHRGGTHIGLILQHTSGESTTMIMAASPSCHRAVLNNRAFINRFKRQCEATTE